MKFNGKDEALKLIKALSPNEAKKIISSIEQSDPNLAEFLTSNLIQIQDIQFLTQTMLMSVLRDIDLATFGFAIKTLDKKIIDKIISQVSLGMKLDIEDGLKSGPTSIDKIEKAQGKLLKLLNEKVQNGQVLFNKNDEFV